jgi:hypothetical protein
VTSSVKFFYTHISFASEKCWPSVSQHLASSQYWATVSVSCVVMVYASGKVLRSLAICCHRYRGWHPLSLLPLFPQNPGSLLLCASGPSIRKELKTCLVSHSKFFFPSLKQNNLTSEVFQVTPFKNPSIWFPSIIALKDTLDLCLLFLSCFPKKI